MRIELAYQLPFTNGQTGVSLVTGFIGVKQFTRLAIGINTTSVAGAPTSWNYVLGIFPTISSGVIGNQGSDVIQSAAQTGTGFALISRLGSQVMSFSAFLDVFEFINIFPQFTGGVSPTAVGTIYIWGAVGEQ